MGALLVTGLVLLVRTGVVKRWKRRTDVSDDAQYVATLTQLSEASVHRRFDPYTDIHWDAPDFAVTQNDPRWVLSVTDPLGRHPWYQRQPLEKQIVIGMWRHANLAKISLDLESILVRGLLQYTFRLPNGSPEYRYCLHESVEECNHILMFQQMVNRIGVDVPGMPWLVRWISPLVPLWAGPLPVVFFFGVLGGEVPIDYLQRNVLRDGRALHPIMERVMAIHVAEEARHLSFADAYLRQHVPSMGLLRRLLLSLYVPIIVRFLCQMIMVPPRSFFREFGIPRSVRTETFFAAPESRQILREMFSDIRSLCHDLGLMNPVALLVWRIGKIDGPPSRYRGEPQRTYPPTPMRAVR